MLLIPTSIPHPPEKYVNLLKAMQNPIKYNKHIYEYEYKHMNWYNRHTTKSNNRIMITT